MAGLDEIDQAHLDDAKDAMAKKAIGGGLLGGGDPAAASAYAQLLEAETHRSEYALKASQPIVITLPPAPAPQWTARVQAQKAAGPQQPQPSGP